MAAEVVRADYDALETIAQRFEASAESIVTLRDQVRKSFDPLAGGDWQGDASEAFCSEMDSEIFPTLDRLDHALREAQSVTQRLALIMQQAEEEAAALFRTTGLEGMSEMDRKLANLGVGTFAGQGGTGGGGADIGSAHSFSGGGGGGGGGAPAAEEAATPAAAPAPPKTLKLTDPPMEGPEVTKLQERLIELGYLEGPASGKYDETTMAAVRSFQENIDPLHRSDGKAGPITLGALDQADAPRVTPGTPMSHDDAIKKLDDAGIPVVSSGNCSDRTQGNCTSLDQMRDVTVDGIVRLKQESGLDITVTGGTEVGHTTLIQQSHENGYKIDIRRTPEVSNYIETNYTSIGTRPSDGAPLYRDSLGNVYAKEGDHWDITFVNRPPDPVQANGFE